MTLYTAWRKPPMGAAKILRSGLTHEQARTMMLEGDATHCTIDGEQLRGSAVAAQRAHNPKVAGSSPAPATNFPRPSVPDVANMSTREVTAIVASIDDPDVLRAMIRAEQKAHPPGRETVLMRCGKRINGIARWKG